MEKLPLKDCAKNWNIPIEQIKTELESSGLCPERVTVATTIDEETAKKLKALLDKRRKGGAKAASEWVGTTKRNMGGSQVVTITQSRGKGRSSHSVGGVGIRERLLARKAQAEAKVAREKPSVTMEKLPLKDCAKNWNIPIEQIKTELESSDLYPKRVTVATAIDEETAKKLKALLDKRRKGGAKAASEWVGTTKRNMGGSQVVTIMQSRGKGRSSHSVGGVGIRERLLARKAQADAKTAREKPSVPVKIAIKPKAKFSAGPVGIKRVLSKTAKNKLQTKPKAQKAEKPLLSDLAKKWRRPLEEVKGVLKDLPRWNSQKTVKFNTPLNEEWEQKLKKRLDEKGESDRKNIDKTLGQPKALGRCSFCKSRDGEAKKIYETKKDADVARMRSELCDYRKLSVYKCKGPAREGWHLSKGCRQCKHREVFYNKEQAKSELWHKEAEGESFENYEISACERCGYTILSRM